MSAFEHRSQPEWVAMEEWIANTVVHPDPALDQAIRTAQAAGMPPIEVAPNSGKLLELLVRIRGARRVLEIGTLAGFSTLFMARALPEDGRLVTIEFSAEHAAVARKNLDDAGVGARVDVRVGAALDVLPTLEGGEPFDLVFIDADKQNNSNYLDWAARLGRPGTVVVLDNTVWEGAPLHPEMDPVNAPAIRASLELLGEDPRFDATVLQTVGSKGWDGFALAVLR
ncbi:putative O-methyltransferase YrrM [Arthrobacter woluwensis]|uniref:O-methyltransferase n=1 Tax=Arthrobacter woluwensis TaxID=156980 RepID=UPI00278ABBE8|nr:O-methyltransferase [Arthrobacter woluwensis]MDQ0707454.1 putative O-methyltransferase YrrM [Arthrobacter woluwensis]